MRSGFCARTSCTPETRGPTHARCRLASCTCSWHDEDVHEKAAALVEAAADPTSRGLNALEQAVHTFHVAAEALAVAALEKPDPVEALRILHRLRAGLRFARDVDAALVQHIYLAGDHGELRVEGLPPVSVVRRKDRKDWDSRGAVFAYLDRKITDLGGEVPEPETVAGWVLDLCGVSYVRVTPLRGVGLESADYCTEVPGSLSVTFVE